MFTAPKRALPYPLDRASNLEVLTPDDLTPCGVPDFPEDSNEKITVLFRLSLNDFVALSTAVDVGSDIAYGDDGIKVWYLWAAAVMCAAFCDEVASCLETENPAVVAALANLIQNNQTIINAISNSITNAGSGIPGQPISEVQAQSDTLPENTKDEEGDCLPNQLWGAVQYLIQSGNRAITDFFEVVEVASNTLERSEIVSQAIPAAGNYISAMAGFADQIGEELAEGYAGAFTEFYEQQLMCDLFCLARDECALTPDMMIQLMYQRLGEPFTIGDFGELMAGVAAGTWVGDEIPDIAFLIYFGAIKFGQQFLSQIGIRPLTVLMSLGADLLASDNWQVLCSCASEWSSDLDFEMSDYGFTFPSIGQYTPGVGMTDTYFAVGGGYRGLGAALTLASPATITGAQMVFEITPGTLAPSGDDTASLVNEASQYLIRVITPEVPVSPLIGTGIVEFNTINVALVCGIGGGGVPNDPGGSCVLKSMRLVGTGTKPPELP